MLVVFAHDVKSWPISYNPHCFSSKERIRVSLKSTAYTQLRVYKFSLKISRPDTSSPWITEAVLKLPAVDNKIVTRDVHLSQAHGDESYFSSRVSLAIIPFFEATTTRREMSTAMAIGWDRQLPLGNHIVQLLPSIAQMVIVSDFSSTAYVLESGPTKHIAGLNWFSSMVLSWGFKTFLHFPSSPITNSFPAIKSDTTRLPLPMAEMYQGQSKLSPFGGLIVFTLKPFEEYMAIMQTSSTSQTKISPFFVTVIPCGLDSFLAMVATYVPSTLYFKTHPSALSVLPA